MKGKSNYLDVPRQVGRWRDVQREIEGSQSL